MLAVKPGVLGTETKPMSLLEVKQNGGGDFRTVVLNPGQTLRGKVIDEKGQPLHGALVTNMTNYFLYSNLQCRTDAQGRFVMPDLAFGRQTISAQYGDQSGQSSFRFDEQNSQCVITVRPIR